MSARRWFLGAGIVAALVVGSAGAVVWSKRDIPPVTDPTGSTEAGALSVPLRQQFKIAGDRYRAFNELVADAQREIFAGAWVDTDTTNVVMPAPGDAFSGSLQGEATDLNSYYFTRSWSLYGVAEGKQKLMDAVQRWEDQGWKASIVESTVNPGDFMVTARAKDGTLFALDMYGDELQLTGYSGIYWGDSDGLRQAMWNIQQTERNEGSQWKPERVNEAGDGLLRPGEYPPFPEWRAVALEERIDKSTVQEEVS